MNYNMLDDEKATKNIELRKKKPAYKAYDEPEYDEFGVVSRGKKKPVYTL